MEGVRLPGATSGGDSEQLPIISTTEQLLLEAAPKLRRRDASGKLIVAEGEELRGLRDYQFDEKCRSWKAPVRRVVPVLELTRMISNKERLLDSQKKAMAKLKVNKEAIQTAEVSLEDDDDDVDGLSLSEDPLEEVPIIRRPFSGKLQQVRYTSWKAPAQERIESGMPLRAQEFSWGKPSGGAGAVSFTSPQQQLVRLEERMSEKDRELHILRSQLFKSQEENYRLIQVLQGYTGKHYEELQEENISLKKYLDRVMRDNARLQGLQMRETNSTLARIEMEERLGARHRVRNSSPSGAATSMKVVTLAGFNQIEVAEI